MNLLHLEYFYTVAKEGGFLRASEKLRIQQPAISRMVASLEDYLGFKLFEKVGRNVRLTSQGKEVFESCKKIFGEVEDLKLSVGKIGREIKGPIYIAASEPIAGNFLPMMIAKMIKAHPKLYPNIYSGPSSLMLKKIENSDIEIGFFFHIPNLSEKLVTIKEIDIPFRLVVHKNYKRDESVLRQFIGSREIDDNTTKEFPTLDLLKKIYPGAKIKISSNNLTTHKELVLNGAGVSVLPEFLIREELKSKTFVDVIPNRKFSFPMKVVARKNAVLSLNSTALLEYI
ncbi:MAG: LysR family transcriptional regulator [Bacteriovoracaceae bacterium]